MISKDVLSALESLHKELDKLEPAIKHVEMAQEVTKSLRGVLEKQSFFLEEVKKSDSQFKTELSKQFGSEVDELSVENKKLQAASLDIQNGTKNAIKTVSEKQALFMEEVKKTDINHKTELRLQFEKEISSIAQENRQLQKVTSEIQKEVRAEISEIKKLQEIIQSFHERIENIRFPERLDKLDANVAGLLAALHAIQSRIETLERNILDKIRDVIELQKESNSKIISEVQSAKQKSQSNSVITWGLIIISAIAIILVLLSK